MRAEMFDGKPAALCTTGYGIEIIDLSQPGIPGVLSEISAPGLAGAMVHLDLKTQLLYSGTRFFINGEAVTVPGRAAAVLRHLADERCASGDELARARLGRLLSDWQRRGYVSVERR